MSLLAVGQRLAAGNLVPFRQASAAAGRGRVLRDEHWMTAERRLLPIVARGRWCQAARDQLFRLHENALEAALLQVLAFRGAEMEALTKARMGEGREKVVE